MATVNTVTGASDAATLGKTLMHEHFLFGFSGFQGDATLGGFQEEDALNPCLQAVETAKAYGIRTIVDATPNECGRNPAFLKKIAETADIRIICATGYYFEQQSNFAYWKFRSLFADVEQEIYDMMLAEVTEGIQDTGIKAGVIKLASGLNGVSPAEQWFFKAAARVQRDTGVPIITHTQNSTAAPEQAALLIAHGAAPEKITIGHMCGNLDLDYHKQVLDQGVFVSLYRFGLEGELFHCPSDEERMDLLVRLRNAGYADHILMGHDSVNIDLGRPLVMNSLMQQSLANADIGNICRRIIPGLKQRGCTDSDIEQLLTGNPQRFFS